MSEANSSSTGHRRWLLLILAVSLGLRVCLAFHGGQGFWPDEMRYQSSQYAAAALVHGQWHEAAEQLLGRADHLLFTWFGLPPAFGQELFGVSPTVVACYFSLFSTLAIYLIWRVARRAGADEGEALVAAFLAACANSLFYYSRHYFPYDIALGVMLLALYEALGPWSAARSVGTGVLAGIGFLTYNGYWLLGGCVLILHGVFGDGGLRRFAFRAALAAAGLALPLGLFILMARMAGHDLVAAFRLNAATVTQGDFHLGYRVIPAYLWHAEGGLFLLWLVGAAATAVTWKRERPWWRAAWWLAGLALVAGGLVLLSDVLTEFVVYGRLVRQLVPFFCLATAFAADALTRRGLLARRALAWGAVVVGALAAWNFAEPLRQVFPDGFRRLAAATVFDQQRSGYGVFRVVNDEHLWGKNLHAVLPPNVVVLRRPHPLQFRPYQYEGFTAAQRRELNRQDVSMRLIRLAGGEGGTRGPNLAADPGTLGGYPGSVRMGLRFAPGEEGRGQPLVTAGTVRHADFLYVVPDGPNRVRFGFDHWDAGTMLSDPVEVDFAQPHELVISLGALQPPAGEMPRRHPDQGYLRSLLLVVLDGKVIWSEWSAAYTVRPETITFGSNFVGGSTAGATFAGRITRLERAPLDDLIPHVGVLAGRSVAARRPAPWDGAAGPIVLHCTLPAVAPGVAQPLLAAGAPAGGDLVFWIRERDDRIRFGFDRWGEGAVFSEPVAAPPGVTHELVISLGSMMPADGNSLYDADPTLRRLRELLLVSLDGRLVFTLRRAFAQPAGDVVFGANSVGSSVASAFFTGNLLSVEPADPAEVLAASIQLASRIKGRPSSWRGYPGPVRVKLFFPTNKPLLPEPLVVTGRTGAGDFIYVRYEAVDRIRIGFDHWGVNGGESPLLTINPAIEHELAISFGALMPPADSPLYQAEPAWRRLRSRLWAALDGRTVFVAPMAVHPTKPGQIMLGVNFIGGSTTDVSFTGQVTTVDDLAPDEVLAQLGPDPTPSPRPTP